MSKFAFIGNIYCVNTQNYKLAISLNPDLTEAHHRLAVYLHVQVSANQCTYLHLLISYLPQWKLLRVWWRIHADD